MAVRKPGIVWVLPGTALEKGGIGSRAGARPKHPDMGCQHPEHHLHAALIAQPQITLIMLADSLLNFIFTSLACSHTLIFAVRTRQTPLPELCVGKEGLPGLWHPKERDSNF